MKAQNNQTYRNSNSRAKWHQPTFLGHRVWGFRLKVPSLQSHHKLLLCISYKQILRISCNFLRKVLQALTLTNEIAKWELQDNINPILHLECVYEVYQHNKTTTTKKC